jgi:predicted dehydrogenase
MSQTIKPIRFAVIGARRGRTFILSANSLCESGVTLAAVCDRDLLALEEWKDTPGVKCYSDYEQVLNDPEIDAVCIATPVPLHARQAIAALEAGKHVLSEVTAAYTLDECWDLVAAVRKSGLTYMMAENYCFMEPVLQVQRMVEEGIFGEIIYASGSYIHDCRDLFFTKEGELTWRGELRKSLQPGCAYPTHSIGPVARWLGINRTDFFKSTTSMASQSAAIPHYIKRNQAALPNFSPSDRWLHPDTVTTCINTEKGALIDLRLDWSSGRPHHMARYELQGTKAALCWPESAGKCEPLIWIEDRSPTSNTGVAEQWEPLSNYKEEFEHPLWRSFREEATEAGHGGGDFFVLREFIGAIQEGRAPLIDVVDAVSWSSITPLSQESIARGNTSVAVPRFDQARP